MTNSTSMYVTALYRSDWINWNIRNIMRGINRWRYTNALARTAAYVKILR